MLAFFVVVLLMIITYFYYKAHNNTKDLAVNDVEISLNSEEKSIHSLRILHISDMHLENISVTPEQLYEVLKNYQIDLIALTGDFLDRKRSIPKLKPYLAMLRRLKATYGLYAVFGNHDYVLSKNDFQRLDKMLNAYGCQTLRNEHRSIQYAGHTLNIIGIDDYSTGRSNLTAAYSGLKYGVNVVLTHDPNVILEMQADQYDYLLAGHFHGGQIHWPKPYHLIKMGKLVRMNMVKGLHIYRNKPFYISEGLGQTGINIRVGSRPEITLHKLIFSNNKAKTTRTAG